MQTVRFHKIGGPEVLVLEEVVDPSPKPGEVLIRVEAVGVNFADILRRRGDPYPELSPLPFTLGAEVAGTIVDFGQGVDAETLGSLVYAACRTGGYAQYVAVPAERAMPVPKGIDAVQATVLVVQGLTAALALRHSGRLVKGENVLVEAAAGGVGSLAVQLAKLYGAEHVIAAASTVEKRAFAGRLGADMTVDYTDANWALTVRELTGERGVDLVLEMTGGPTLHRALDALGPFGRMVVYGLASAETALVDPQRLVLLNQSVTGFYIGAYFNQKALIETTLKEIADYVVSGRLSLEVGTLLPLSRAAEAHHLLETRQTTGKVVLQPWPS